MSCTRAVVVPPCLTPCVRCGGTSAGGTIEGMPCMRPVVVALEKGTTEDIRNADGAPIAVHLTTEIYKGFAASRCLCQADVICVANVLWYTVPQTVGKGPD